MSYAVTFGHMRDVRNAEIFVVHGNSIQPEICAQQIFPVGRESHEMRVRAVLARQVYALPRMNVARRAVFGYVAAEIVDDIHAFFGYGEMTGAFAESILCLGNIGKVRL